MLNSLHSVNGSRTVPATFMDRGNIWPSHTVAAGPQTIDIAPLEEGLLTGAMVATDTGWRKVENIVAGDQVLTFDSGLREVVSVETAQIECQYAPGRQSYVLDVPVGVLGNRRDMKILPSQELVIESDFAEDQFGDPFVLLPALMLLGYKGISKSLLDRKMAAHMLVFEREEVAHVNGAALILCRSNGGQSARCSTIAPRQTSYKRYARQILVEIVKDLRAPRRSAAFDGQDITQIASAIEMRMS